MNWEKWLERTANFTHRTVTTFFLKNGKSDYRFSYQWNSSEFVENALRAEIRKIAYDALSIYKYDDDTSLDYSKNMQVGVFPSIEKSIREISVTVTDVLIAAMLAVQKFDVHKVKIQDEKTKKTIIFCYIGELDENGFLELPLAREDRKVVPEHSVTVCPFYEAYQLEGAQYAFERLWHLQQRMKGSDWIASKLVLKKDGANAALQLIGKGRVEGIAMMAFEEFKKDLEKQMNEVWGAEKILLDTRDSIEFMNSNDKNIEYIKMYMQFIYSEIARNLMEPVTRVAGVSASGLNATGEGDANNYEMTLQRARQYIIDPYAREMGIEMIKVQKRDINVLSQALNMHSLLGLEPDEELITALKEIAL